MDRLHKPGNGPTMQLKSVSSHSNVNPPTILKIEQAKRGMLTGHARVSYIPCMEWGLC
jgi:hypothetical protein